MLAIRVDPRPNPKPSRQPRCWLLRPHVAKREIITGYPILMRDPNAETKRREGEGEKRSRFFQPFHLLAMATCIQDDDLLPHPKIVSDRNGGIGSSSDPPPPSLSLALSLPLSSDQKSPSTKGKKEKLVRKRTAMDFAVRKERFAMCWASLGRQGARLASS